MASKGKEKGVLLWSTSHSLTLEGAFIAGAHGVSAENRQLLLQRGAVEKEGKEKEGKKEG